MTQVDPEIDLLFAETVEAWHSFGHETVSLPGKEFAGAMLRATADLVRNHADRIWSLHVDHHGFAMAATASGELENGTPTSPEVIMDVYFTGAGGYIGGAVVRRLIREGHTVRGLTRTPGVVDASPPLASNRPSGTSTTRRCSSKRPTAPTRSSTPLTATTAALWPPSSTPCGVRAWVDPHQRDQRHR
ncbi:hypothetical protein ACFW6C_33870 [Streptomyces fungicidicus]|uniref:hypothetical protein n=1 Tax=Streptomyces fungicidicus TaxID=68203 RepID=UPI0033246956